MTRTGISMIVLLACVLSGVGCEPPVGDRALVSYSTLPNRSVQATYPAEFERVHAACVQVLRDQSGYIIGSEETDATTGFSRIDATTGEGASVRLETERSRDLVSVSVKLFAVEAGAQEPSVDRARELLNRIEDVIWSSK